ncbi:MAG: YgjV family protein [Synergistes sp.]|nr:YgjV family protein [Synergistes sp.]
MYRVAAQLIGFVGTALLIASYQCRKSKDLFLLQMGSNVMYIIHFIMLGALSGSVSIFLGLTRNFILYSHTHRWAQWKGWLPLIIAGYVFGTYITWKDWYSILPCVGMTVMTAACWSRNGKNIRIANFAVNSPAWLVYDIHAFSISGVVTETFCLVSIIVSFFRYGWKALDGEG